MTSKEIHDQITAYVDDRIDESAYRSRIEQQIRSSAGRGGTYEEELLAKTAIGKPAADTLADSRAGDAPRAAIAGDDESSTAGSGLRGPTPAAPTVIVSAENGPDRMARIFTAPLGVTLAVVLVVLGVLALLRPGEEGTTELKLAETEGPVVEKPKASGPVNLFNKASANFRALIAGELGMSYQTEDANDLNRYFKEQGVAYTPASVPVRAALAGGIVTDHGTSKFAHLIYKDGGTVIYLFEVPMQAIQSRQVVYVSDVVLAQINGGKPFWEEPDPSTSIVLFKRGEIICAMVANVPRSRLEKIVSIG